MSDVYRVSYFVNRDRSEHMVHVVCATPADAAAYAQTLEGGDVRVLAVSQVVLDVAIPS
jgi:hypothetical protein